MTAFHANSWETKTEAVHVTMQGQLLPILLLARVWLCRGIYTSDLQCKILVYPIYHTRYHFLYFIERNSLTVTWVCIITEILSECFTVWLCSGIRASVLCCSQSRDGFLQVLHLWKEIFSFLTSLRRIYDFTVSTHIYLWVSLFVVHCYWTCNNSARGALLDKTLCASFNYKDVCFYYDCNCYYCWELEKSSSTAYFWRKRIGSSAIINVTVYTKYSNYNLYLNGQSLLLFLEKNPTIFCLYILWW